MGMLKVDRECGWGNSGTGHCAVAEGCPGLGDSWVGGGSGKEPLGDAHHPSLFFSFVVLEV